MIQQTRTFNTFITYSSNLNTKEDKKPFNFTMKLTLQKPNIICHQNNHKKSDKKHSYNDSYILGFRGEDHLYSLETMFGNVLGVTRAFGQGLAPNQLIRDYTGINREVI